VVIWRILAVNILQVDSKMILSVLGWSNFNCGLTECANILLFLTQKFSYISCLALMIRYWCFTAQTILLS